MVDKKPQPIKETYDSSQITVLEGLAPVRKRPGMYIGGTGEDGLHHLVWEILDNAIDEAMAGFCTKIIVTLHDDGSVSVFDNGRGIPVDKHKVTGKSALETVLTVLHAGGKFGDGGYKVSSGLHGVGASVVNALSVWVKAWVRRDNKEYFQEFHQGDSIGDVKVVGESTETGTTIQFLPDPEIFTSTTEFSFQTILNRCRQQAYLTKGIFITIKDERETVAKKLPEKKAETDENVDEEDPDEELRTGRGGGDEDEEIIEKETGPKQYSFYFEGGIASYVRHINKNREVFNDPPIYIEKEQNGVMIEAALAYTNDFKEHIYSFANHVNTPEGGTHLTGFKTALTRALNDYAKKNNLTKDVLTGEDVREGLTAVISVKLADPQFEGQTKAKLGNTEVRTAVESVTAEKLSAYMDEHPIEAKKTIEKCSLSAKARLAARAARETIIRKGALDGMTLPGKLADCSSRDPKKTEIYIVEGDSAGGCWDGNTKIALTDGRDLSFKELVEEDERGKHNFCYTIQNDGSIGIAPILNPRITKSEAEVIKVTLDNGAELICTPDHLFMMRDGSYLPAKDLKDDLSLMPFRKKISQLGGRITIDGYEMVLNPQNHRWIFTHLLADDYNRGGRIYPPEIGSHRHHKDFNKLNNNPSNIIRMSRDEHLALHRKHADLTLHTPQAIAKCNIIKRTDKYRQKISNVIKLNFGPMLSEKAKKQWSNPDYKKFMLEKYMSFYNSNKEFREKNLYNINKAQQKYWSDEKNRVKQSEKVKKYFLSHPETKSTLSQKSKAEWQNVDLLNWRKEQTRKQWTEEFRIKRRTAYDQVYLHTGLSFAKRVFELTNDINLYDRERSSLPKRNPNLIKMETLINRFFRGDKKQFVEAVENFNHKIKKIDALSRKIDVYDIEVPLTHNFALSSGIFVHNSAKQGRDRNFQAILPLRGKILNVERARLDRMLASDEIKALIVAMGVGIGDEINYSKLRYDRIILMTDADVDGAHIRTLLLTFLFRNFPDLISHGHVYIAQPPLFSVAKGKEKEWVYTEAERDEAVKRMMSKKSAAPEEGQDEETVLTGTKPTIQRFKGLGEMSAEQLWETTMNPINRVLLQVTMDDAEKADEVFTVLMGDQVPPRKKFIQTRAKTVQNLDA